MMGNTAPARNSRDLRSKLGIEALFKDVAAAVPSPPTTRSQTVSIDPDASLGSFRISSTMPYEPAFFIAVNNALLNSDHLAAFQAQAAGDGLFPAWRAMAAISPVANGPTFDLATCEPQQLVHELAQFFILYVQKTGESRFDESKFNVFWEACGGQLLQGTTRASRKVGLYNVDTVGETYRLSAEVLLRPITAEETKRYDETGFAKSKPLPIISVLDVLIDSGLSGANLNEKSQAEIDFDFAIALITNGFLDEAIVDELVPAYNGTRGAIMGGRTARRSSPTISLDSVMAAEIGAAMSGSRLVRSGSGAKQRRVNISMNRYVRALQREPIEDAFIDLWIALESLFGESTEITFKLAFRIATYTESDRQKRREVFRAVRDSYTARSKLVHGERPDVDTIAYRVALNACSRALRRICDDPGSYPEALNEIELALLERELP